MTEDQAITIVNLFLSAYPNTPADAGTADLWIAILSPVPYEDAHGAALEWIRGSRFFPTPKDIGDILERRHDADYGERTKEIATAYAQLRLANTTGVYDVKAFTDSQYRAALQMPELHRLEREYPTAGSHLLACALNGERQSLQYYPRITTFEDIDQLPFWQQESIAASWSGR